MSRILVTAAAFALSGGLFAAPAQAQQTGESVNQLIIYGNDPCPASSGDQITVCARKAESERYRIPEPLRASQSLQNDAWNNRVIAYETVGKSGALSCSPTGAGGWTGCLNHMIDTAYAERDSDASVRFGELIAAERARRLATIDADAQETQERVEDAERAHEARKADEAVAQQSRPDGTKPRGE